MKSKNEPLKRMPLERPKPKCLTFDPLCWLKLQYFCHAGDTEIGGFGISAADDPLYIQDFATVMQATTCVSVEFSDNAVADYFDSCVDRGLKPQQFARVWLHTHPGDSPEPSSVDERTFADVFGKCDWSLMFILSRTGRTYARLGCSAGPEASLELPVAVDWENWPQHAADGDLPASVRRWQKEFEDNIYPIVTPSTCKLLADPMEEASPWYDEEVMLAAYEELARTLEVP